MVEQALHSELAWIGPARTQVAELLDSMQGVLDGVYAHIGADELHLYVLDTLTDYDHDLALALGRLEVRLTKVLEQNFEDVQVHTVPVSGLREDELGFLRSGVQLL